MKRPKNYCFEIKAPCKLQSLSCRWKKSCPINIQKKIAEIQAKIDALYPFDLAPSLSIPFQYNNDIKQILTEMLKVIKEPKEDES